MRLRARCTNNVKYTNTARYNDMVFMNIYWIDMFVVPVVQFAAKSTQKTAMYFASEMDRKWRPSNKNRNIIGQTLFIHGSGCSHWPIMSMSMILMTCIYNRRYSLANIIIQQVENILYYYMCHISNMFDLNNYQVWPVVKYCISTCMLFILLDTRSLSGLYYCNCKTRRRF